MKTKTYDTVDWLYESPDLNWPAGRREEQTPAGRHLAVPRTVFRQYLSYFTVCWQIFLRLSIRLEILRLLNPTPGHQNGF